jgi:hypothetical protein
MSGSSEYSTAAPFTVTNSAEAYDYDELFGLLLSFSQARMTGTEPEVWSANDVQVKMREVVRSLRGLSAVLADMTPQLQFQRRPVGGRPFLMNARAAIEGHIATMQVWIQNFTAEPSKTMFGHIQTYVAEFVAADVEKLERRHTRVILGASGSARMLSRTPVSTNSGSGSESGSDASLYGSRGGARRGKKLTRRRR